MPVDLKWIRINPAAVKEWQRIRAGRRRSDDYDVGADGIDNKNDDDIGVVQHVIELDTHCRKVLLQLNEQRTKLKSLQQSLRPPPKPTNKKSSSKQQKSDGDGDDIHHQRQQKEEQVQVQQENQQKQQNYKQELTTIQNHIKQLEIEWKELTKQVEESLWNVASPIDSTLDIQQQLNNISQQHERQQKEQHDDENHEDSKLQFIVCDDESTTSQRQSSSHATTTTSTKKKILLPTSRHHFGTTATSYYSHTSSNIGLDIKDGFFHYTRHYFRNYSTCSQQIQAGTVTTTSRSGTTNKDEKQKLHDSHGNGYDTSSMLLHIIDRKLAQSMAGSLTSNKQVVKLLDTWIGIVEQQRGHHNHHHNDKNAVIVDNQQDQQTSQKSNKNKKNYTSKNTKNNANSNKSTILGAKQLPRFVGLWTYPPSSPPQPPSLSPSSATTATTNSISSEYHNRSVDDAESTHTSNSSSELEFDTFQIVALTAGTLWDSRYIQGMLLQQMIDFYSSLHVIVVDSTTGNDTSGVMKVVATPSIADMKAQRVGTGNSNTSNTGTPPSSSPKSSSWILRARLVDPTQLELHELSRIVVEAKMNNPTNSTEDTLNDGDTTNDDDVYTLGWVSNYGDASTRACQLQYAGGASGTAYRGGGSSSTSNNKKKKTGSTPSSTTTATIKDYVHVVHAMICHEETMQWMLLQNQAHHEEFKQGQLLTIPKAVAKYMVTAPDIPSISDKERREDGEDDLVGFSIPMKKLDGTSLSMSPQRQDPAFSPLWAKRTNQQQRLQTSSIATKELKVRTDSVNNKKIAGPKFPPVTISGSTSGRVRQESLVCPYDFLVGT